MSREEDAGEALLPPILFLTGANGAGKTTIYRHLLGTVTEAVLIDHDLLWGTNPAFDDPSDGYRTFRTLVLAMAMRIAANGHLVVVEGTTVPWEYEDLPDRRRISRTSYLAAVCDDADLEQRLRARPPERQHGEDFIAGMVRMNQVFATEASGWSPPVELVSTAGGVSVDESAAVVHDWIRREHDGWRRVSGRG